jgi:hypothetical protein
MGFALPNDAQLQVLGIVLEEYMTAEEVLQLLLTVDGLGSGLDADLLDGHAATYFATSTHTHSGVYEPVDATLLRSSEFGTTLGSVCQGNDARLSDARTPVSHDHSGNKLAQANTHQSADTDSTTTALHHTLGTGANQACAGSDSRLSDARTPVSHDHSGNKLAQANTHETADTDSATSSLHHTIGTSATQAAAGNHAHATMGTFLLFGATSLANSATAPTSGQYLRYDGSNISGDTVSGSISQTILDCTTLLTANLLGAI